MTLMYEAKTVIRKLKFENEKLSVTQDIFLLFDLENLRLEHDKVQV